MWFTEASRERKITFIHNAVPYVLSSAKYWPVEAYVQQQIELLFTKPFFPFRFSGVSRNITTRVNYP